MADMNIQPEYQIEEVTGNFTRTITVWDETKKTREINGVERIFTTRKMRSVPETFTEGYMVYYPQGHSLLIAKDDHDQLVHLGLGFLTQDGEFVLGQPSRVDMESGDQVPEGFALTPKEIVKRKENNRPRQVGGIAAAME